MDAFSTSARKRAWFQHVPVPNAAQPPLPVPTDNSIYAIWHEALDRYKETFQIDLCDMRTPLGQKLASCHSKVDFLDAIHGTIEEFSERRKGSALMSTVREALKPVVFGLSAFLDAGAEAASTVVPGGKGIFVAICVLFRAAERATARFDDLLKLLKQLRAYIDRLGVRVQAALGREARALAVDALVKTLKALTLATRMMGEGRLGRFVRALFSKADDVREVIEDLEGIMVEEERLSVAEIVVGMHSLSLTLHDVVSSSARVESGVYELRDRLSIVHHSLHGRLDQMQNHIDAVPHSQPASLQLTLNFPNVDAAFLRDTIRYLSSLLSSANAEDRAFLGQALAALYTWAAHTVISDSGHNAAGVVLATVYDPVQVLATFIPMAITMLSVFALWKCIFKPLCVPGGNIVLTDALGRSFILDSDTFLSRENVHTFLLAHFRGQQGLRYVQKRSYMLSDAENSRVIEMELWAQLMRPGMRLEMAIHVRTLLLRCPWCQSSVIGSVSANKHITCPNAPCRRTFRAFKYRRDDPVSQSKSPPSQARPEPSPPSEHDSTTSAVEADNMFNFRQIVIQFSRDNDGPSDAFTFERLVNLVKEKVRKFIKSNANQKTTDPYWAVGPGRITAEDLDLLAVLRVTREAVMPILKLRDEFVFPHQRKV